ncbi:MAG: DoxX family protein [Deltaproteobacteria bacterium]|nr:DoxX family protein [Deltaproteobacteria bacterium]
MKLDQPIGDSMYGPLFIRAALGCFLVMSGLARLENPQLLIDRVQQTGIFPEKWGTVYAILLPYVEILSGGLFIGGFWTTLASIVVSVVLGSFLYIFGTKVGTPGAFNFTSPFNKDLVLLAAAVAVMFTGPGAFSIDGFRKGSG